MARKVTCPTCGKPLDARELLRQLLAGAVSLWIARLIWSRLPWPKKPATPAMAADQVKVARDAVRDVRKILNDLAGEAVAKARAQQETPRQQASREYAEQLRQRRANEWQPEGGTFQ